MNEKVATALNEIFLQKKQTITEIIAKINENECQESEPRDVQNNKSVAKANLEEQLSKIKSEKDFIEIFIACYFHTGILYLQSKCLPKGLQYVNKMYLQLKVKDEMISVGDIVCIYKKDDGQWFFKKQTQQGEYKIFDSLLPVLIQDEIMQETCAILNKF